MRRYVFRLNTRNFHSHISGIITKGRVKKDHIKAKILIKTSQVGYGILKMNIGSVLECQGQQKILKMRERLRELDAQRNDLVMMIANGTCSEDTLDTEFAKIYAEEQELNAQLQAFEIPTDAQEKIDSTMQDISREKFQLEVFDDIIIRKVLDCVKVLSKTELLVVFKGNAAVNVTMED